MIHQFKKKGAPSPLWPGGGRRVQYIVLRTVDPDLQKKNKS